VHHDTPETTPQLKLFVVIYSGHVLPAQYRPFVDGINLWIYNQNGLYTNIDTYVTQFRATYPGKEINCGIYIMNGDYGWMTPTCVDYMYRDLLNRYDDGDVNGVMLFAGHWIIMPNITRERWDADRLPALLDEVYYPFVGRGAWSTSRAYRSTGPLSPAARPVGSQAICSSGPGSGQTSKDNTASPPGRGIERPIRRSITRWPSKTAA
jgi:hypothetical protein